MKKKRPRLRGRTFHYRNSKSKFVIVSEPIKSPIGLDVVRVERTLPSGRKIEEFWEIKDLLTFNDTEECEACGDAAECKRCGGG